MNIDKFEIKGEILLNNINIIWKISIKKKKNNKYQEINTKFNNFSKSRKIFIN